MYQKLRKQTEGFTIIEVLIVLAIAGLIMLIVFLAVPALQRNSRNNARNSDGARISAAVTECLANRNNDVTAQGCGNAANIQPGDRSQLTGAITFAGTGNTGAAAVRFGQKCNPQASGIVAGSQRDFAVLFQLEVASGTPLQRCIGSQ